MARSNTTDPFQNYRFHLVESGGDGTKYLGAEAGFVSVTVPDISLDPAEYKTGVDKYKKKYPGPPTVGDVSLSQGIFKAESKLYAWVIDILNGGKEYRRDLQLWHFHLRDTFQKEKQPLRVIQLYNCWPTMVKPNPEFEANSGDVSIAEMTLACESFEIRRGKAVTSS
jgi:phage tail-like protein